MARSAPRSLPSASIQEARRRMSSLGFFGETFGELQKVTWPTREQAMRLTFLVVLISAAFGLTLGAIDGLFFRILDITLF